VCTSEAALIDLSETARGAVDRPASWATGLPGFATPNGSSAFVLRALAVNGEDRNGESRHVTNVAPCVL
jgi:hypothetical protein